MQTRTQTGEWRGIAMLALPVLALVLWGILANRPKPPRPPVPFERNHLQREVVAQVTEQLVGHSWISGTEQLKFGEAYALPARGARMPTLPVTVLQRNAILMPLLIECETRVPTQAEAYSTMATFSLKLTRQNKSSRFAGIIDDPMFGIIRISFDVTNEKSPSSLGWNQNDRSGA
jgi:hypothetical protein